MNINELKSKNFNQLVQIGGDLELADAKEMRKDDLVEQILQRQVERTGQVYVTGILDIVDDGYGFLRRHGLMPSQDDIYVSSIAGAPLRPARRRPRRRSRSARPRTARSTGACCGSRPSTASTPRPPSAGLTSMR